MSNMVEKLAAAGHLSAEQVERIGRNVAAFKRAYDEDSDFAKQADGFSSIAKGVGGAALTAAAVAGTQTLMNKAISSVQSSLSRSRDYKRMMDLHPHLAQHDAKAVQRAFGTLHRFNPEYASDPTTAGAFVQNTLGSERFDINALNSIVMARKNLAEATAKRQNIDIAKFLKPEDPMHAVRSRWEVYDRPLKQQLMQLEHHQRLEAASPEAYEYVTGRPKPKPDPKNLLNPSPNP